MLAWLHQTLATERELLEALLGRPEDAVPPSPTTPASATTAIAEPNTDLAVALETVADGCGRPLRVRVEQLLAGGIGPLLAFRLGHLLQFYVQTLARVLGPGNRLVAIIIE
jgi:conserved oligomeric Golgi complex subunit 6